MSCVLSAVSTLLHWYVILSFGYTSNKNILHCPCHVHRCLRNNGFFSLKRAVKWRMSDCYHQYGVFQRLGVVFFSVCYCVLVCFQAVNCNNILPCIFNPILNWWLDGPKILTQYRRMNITLRDCYNGLDCWCYHKTNASFSFPDVLYNSCQRELWIFNEQKVTRKQQYYEWKCQFYLAILNPCFIGKVFITQGRAMHIWVTKLYFCWFLSPVKTARHTPQILVWFYLNYFRYIFFSKIRKSQCFIEQNNSSL